MVSLDLRFLGLFSVSDGNLPLTGFESNKVRGLLAYLAVESGRPHARESLAGLLWPEWPDGAARSNLRYALADLRKTIRDQQATPPFLLITRDSIQFNTGSAHRLDVAEFNHLASATNGAAPLDERIERLEQALGLYQGQFLEGFTLTEAAPFEEWARLKREQFHRQYLQLLSTLAADCERQGNLARALTFAWKLVEIEPWQEEAQRQLMHLLAMDGQRSAALAQYESCVRVLAQELQVEPGIETKRLYESIRDGVVEARAGGRPALDDLPPAPGAAPFMGLQYFDEPDADLFFGREMLVARLVGRLNRMGAERFLAVVGASGSGKSSLVHAGLVPAIRSWSQLADGTSPPRQSHHWLVHVITPTAHPLEALATSLTREAGPVSATTALIDDLGSDPRSLHLYARRITHLKRAPRLLLVVDQFEELFTLCRSESERALFIENLLVAVGVTSSTDQSPAAAIDDEAQDGPLILVIALRADFYNQCGQYAGLRQALSQHQEFIGPMSTEELRRAIEEPARRNNWEFEPGLVELILREISDEPGGLPLLSHALLETWQRRRGRTMTLKGYAEAGGIRGAIAQTAENVYTSLSSEKRALARRIFLRLTELGDGNQDTRRRASLSELLPSAGAAPLLESVLNTLVAARLVTAGEATVEVAHEALIREWPNLRRWLDEDRESLRLHRHLTEAAHAWEAMGCDTGDLYRGARLAQAVEWAALAENADALNGQEREFLRASLEFEEREKTERDAQRQRELEAAQRAAAAERLRAEEQALAAQRQKRRALFLAGALLLALVLAGTALLFAIRSSALAVQNAENARQANTQRAIAESEALARSTQQAIAETEAEARGTAEALAKQDRDAAVARELVAASANNLLAKGDPELSGLLALRSMDILPSPDAENALRQALLAMRVERVLSGHTTFLQYLEYSPDGTRLVSTGNEAEVKIWDVVKGQEILTLSDGVYTSAIFSPDGRKIAAYREDGTARIWDAATGSELLRVPAAIYWTSELAFSPDGRLLATPTDSGVTSIWDTGSGRLVVSLEGHTDSAWGASFSPDGKRLVTSSEDGTAIVWDTVTWKPVRTITSSANAFSAVVFSPDGTRLALSNGSEIVITDFATGADLLHIPGAGLALVYSRDGTRLATASAGSDTRVLDAFTGEQLLSLPGNNSAAGTIAFSPDGKHLATSIAGGTVIIWDVSPEGSRELLSVAYPGGMTGRIAVAPDASSFATTNFDGTVQVWDTATGRELQKIQAHTGAAWDVDYSPDGTRLVTAGEDALVKVWDLSTGKELLKLEGHVDLPTYSVGGFFNGVLEAVFSPDGAWIASGGEDGTVKLWDATNGNLLQAIPVHPDHNGVTNVRFSPDGSLLAATTDGTNATVVLWRISRTTAEEIFRHTDPEQSRFWGLAISPSNTVAVGGSTGVLRLIPPEASMQGMVERMEHGATVVSAVYSADGAILATSSRDGTVKIRDGKSGAVLKTIQPGHDLRFIALSADGRILFTAGADVVARAFLVRTEDLIALANSRLSRGFTQKECQQYLHLDQCP